MPTSMRLLALFALALMSGLSLAPAQESRTADYYLNKPDRYLGKKITLNCAYVERREGSFNTDPQYVTFDAYTYGRGNGGTVTAVATSWCAYPWKSPTSLPANTATQRAGMPPTTSLPDRCLALFPRATPPSSSTTSRANSGQTFLDTRKPGEERGDFSVPFLPRPLYHAAP